MTRLTTCAVIVLGLMIPLRSAMAENWPQWRGPNLNGSTSETSLPDKLDPAAALWNVELPGHGACTPIVWEDRVFVSSLDSQTRKLLAMCLDNKTGKVLWQKETGDGFVSNDRNDMATPSPITDGKTVWFYYGSGDLVAFDFEGNKLWARNIQEEFGPFNINWIYGSSPLLFDGKLYVQVIHRNVSPRGGRGRGRRGGGGAPAAGGGGQAESYLLGVDPATGKDLFRVIRPTPARGESMESYATPIAHEAEGRKEVILVGGDCVTGHDAETGKEIWRMGGWNPSGAGNWRVIPSVVVVGDKVVFCTPQGQGRVIAINLGGEGDISGTHKAWENNQAKSDVPVPLVYQDNLYVLDGDSRKGVSCLDPATGQTRWSMQIPSRAVLRASPTGADGKIYVMNETAEVWVLAAADGKVLSNTTLSSEGTSRGSIVAAQGRLFVRTGNRLYCFGQAG